MTSRAVSSGAYVHGVPNEVRIAVEQAMARGESVDAICERHGVSHETYWRIEARMLDDGPELAPVVNIRRGHKRAPMGRVPKFLGK